jgi:RNA-directed DNA polymerase
MINTLKHLAFILKCSTTAEEILKICGDLESNNEEIDKKYYRKQEVEKVSSGKVKIRTLYPSLGRLKLIQERIRKNILQKIELPVFLHGGIKGRSNLTNAKKHQGKKFKFTTDLKMFFPSVTSPLIYEMFIKNGFSPDVSRALTILTSYKGMLPQGTPTSTHIANLVLLPLDFKIYDFCKINSITYTRFVDDLSMSSSVDFKDDCSYLLEFIRKANFRISHKKTNYNTMTNVTGLKVGNNSLQATEKFLKTLKDCESLSQEQLKGKKDYLKRIKEANDGKP